MIKRDELITVIGCLSADLSVRANQAAIASNLGTRNNSNKLDDILVYNYYEYLIGSSKRINLVTEDNEIILNVGQQLEPIAIDGEIVANLGAAKEYNEAAIVEAIKNINSILKTNHTIPVYADKYFEYEPQTP